MSADETARPRNFLAGLALCAAAAGLLLFAAWPVSMRTETYPILSENLPAGYSLRIEYPDAAPVGEIASVRAALVPPAGVAKPVGDFRFAVFTLESGTMLFEPAGQTVLALPDSQTAGMTWKAVLTGGDPATFTLLVGMRAVDEANPSAEDHPVWGKSFTVRSRPGLGGWKTPAVISSAFLLLVGLLLVLVYRPATRAARRR